MKIKRKSTKQIFDIEYGQDLKPLFIDDNSHTIPVHIFGRMCGFEILNTVSMTVRVSENPQLVNNRYVIKINGIQKGSWEVYMERILAINPGFIEEDISGKETVEPIYKSSALWIPKSKQEYAESIGFIVWDPSRVITEHLKDVINPYFAKFVRKKDRQDFMIAVWEDEWTFLKQEDRS